MQVLWVVHKVKELDIVTACLYILCAFLSGRLILYVFTSFMMYKIMLS